MALDIRFDDWIRPKKVKEERSAEKIKADIVHGIKLRKAVSA